MAVKTVTFTLNGQTYNLTYDASSETYKATVTAPSTTSWNENSDHKFHGTAAAADEAGNSVSATVSDFPALSLRVLEKVEPTIAVTYPTAGAAITNAKPTFRWTVTDTGSGIDAATISIRIDSGAAVTDGIGTTATADGYTCEYTPGAALAEGSHTVAFDVSDNDGNTAAQETAAFKIDTVPPTLNITSPAEGYITNNATLPIVGTTNDATSSPVTVEISVNDGTAQEATVTNGAFSHNVTLTEGSNTVKIVATDAAGKSTTITRTVVLDTIAPVITAIKLTPNPVDAGATYIVEITVTD